MSTEPLLGFLFGSEISLEEIEQHVHGGRSGGGEVLVAAVVFLEHDGLYALAVAHSDPDGADEHAVFAVLHASGAGDPVTEMA